MSDCMPDAYGVDIRKARKDHICNECRGLIKAGESYYYHHGVWDYQGRDFKLCPECNQLMVDINGEIEYPEDRVSFDLLYEHATENLKYLTRFIEIKRKRGASLVQWMLDRQAKMKEKESAK